MDNSQPASMAGVGTIQVQSDILHILITKNILYIKHYTILIFIFLTNPMERPTMG